MIKITVTHSDHEEYFRIIPAVISHQTFGDFARITFFDDCLVSISSVPETAEKAPYCPQSEERHTSSESSGSVVCVCKVS